MIARLFLVGALALAVLGADWVRLNQAGKAAYGRGQYSEAERLFRQALAEAPDEPELHYHRGVALTHLHRWAEAAAAYERALALRPAAPLATAIRQAQRSIEPMTRPRTPPAAPEPDSVAAPRAAPRRPPPPRPLPSDSVRLQRQWGNWYVEVTLNDMQRVVFLLDTGASACAITPELAASIGIIPDPDVPPVRVEGIAGGTWGRRVKIPSIRVGDSEAEEVVATVMPLPWGMQGILGNTFLSRFTTTLDPGQSVLTLRPR